MFIILSNRLIDNFKIVILEQLYLLNLKARVIIFPRWSLLQFTQLYYFIFPKVVAKDPLKNVMLNFIDCSSYGRAAYVVSGEK